MWSATQHSWKMLREEIILSQKAAHKLALTIAWQNWQHGTLSLSEAVFQSVKLFLHWMCILFYWWMYHVWCSSKICIFMYINPIRHQKGIIQFIIYLYIYFFVFLCYHKCHTICMFIAPQMFPDFLFMGLLLCYKGHREKASLFTKSEKLHDTAIG